MTSKLAVLLIRRPRTFRVFAPSAPYLTGGLGRPPASSPPPRAMLDAVGAGVLALALVGLAVVRLRRGALPEDTLALLRRALARADGRPPAAETRLAQGTVLALLGRYDPARAHLRAALAGLAPAVRRGAERTIAEVDALLD